MFPNRCHRAAAASSAPRCPRDTGEVVFAHANGFSWDEALMVLAPIAVLAAILLYVNNKLRRGLGDQLLDDEPLGDRHLDDEPVDDRPLDGRPLDELGTDDVATGDGAAPSAVDPTTST
jgi:hypothetical protein